MERAVYFLTGIIFALPCSWDIVANAQLIPDGSLGLESSTVNQISGIRQQIEGGALREHNLFHSFQDFNVAPQTEVYFANPVAVENILTRVTGTNISNIFGTLGVLGNANLFLINPNGIQFGTGARLDIAGSFFASTAIEIGLDDGSFLNIANANQDALLSINPNALFTATLRNYGGDIQSQGDLIVGKDLSLQGNNLVLSGTLQAGDNLHLYGSDTVTVRDQVDRPFIAAAGNKFVLQGDNGVDIFALNNVDSGFWSAGNMILRSDNSVIGDAHFYAGGNFNVEKLDGSFGNLISPNDPVFLASGNITWSDYRGASLHILAGGSVTINNITIDETGTQDTTISKNNPSTFLASLAVFNLADYKTVLDSNGTIKQVLPVLVPIEIDGSNQATVDIRAGVDWSLLGGLPTSPIIGISNTFTESNPPVNADIIVQRIGTNNLGGLVLLTNQFSPNTLTGKISIGSIDTSTTTTEVNGGDIQVYGRGNITAGVINSTSFSSSGNAGNGGIITVTSNSGNISLDNSVIKSNSISFLGNVGNGGVITVTSNSGNISLINSDLDSHAYSSSGNTGDGGAIYVAANFGNIFLVNSNLDSSISSSLGNPRNGGEIYIASNSGNILLSNLELYSFSVSSYGNTGNGGMVSFASNSGNISLDNSTMISNSITAYGNAANGGGISFVSNFGNLSLVNSNLSSQSYSTFGNTRNGGTVLFISNFGNILISDSTMGLPSFSSYGNAGNGGEILFVSNSGDISLNNSNFFSHSITTLSGNAGNGGGISFASDSGNISLNNSISNSYSYSEGGDTGNGGKISISSNSGNISLINSDSYSYSYSSFGNAGKGGEIFLSATNGSITGFSSLYSMSLAENSLGQKSGSGGTVTLEAKNQISNLEIFTQSSSGAAGTFQINGLGDLTISNFQISTSKTVSFPNPRDSSQVITFDTGTTGQSGDVTILGLGSLTFENTVINSATQGIESAGNTSIVSPTFVTFQNDSQILSNTNNIGNAGSISVKSGQGIIIKDDSIITARTGGDMDNAGKAGDITLNAPILKIIDGSQVLAETNSSGAGGNITINALTSVDLTRLLDSSPVVSVQASNKGKAGNILINTPILTLADRANITATATATSTNTNDAGSITLNASQMNLFGTLGVFAETQGQAPAGTLLLKPYQNNPDLNIKLFEGSKISASTSGSGNGGDLIITAPDTININGQGILAVETSFSGDAGDIKITTQNLNLADGVTLSASTSSSGDAGNIEIAANNFNLSNNATIQTNTSSSGDAGDILLNTPTLRLTNGGKIFAFTEGSGDGGTITVNAVNSVNIGEGVQNFAPILSVETSNAGKAGNIIVNTPKLTISDTARITATATETATNSEGGGSIILNSDLMNLAGIVGVFAETQGQAPAGTLLLKPYQNNPDLNIKLFAGSKISASTSGSGNGGDLVVTAPNNINISGRGTLAVETSSSGDAGTISVTSKNLTLSDSVTLSASTSGSGDGGFIKFTVAEDINIFDSFVQAITQEGSTGKGGSIDIDPNNTNLVNSSIAVNSKGSGIGGDIFVTSGLLSLNNSELTTETFSSDGGNIYLDIDTFLFLSNGSNISATAGRAEQSGNGGNITIFAPFIFAPRDQDNNIRAEAFAGTGGNIFIKTIAIAGLDFTGTDILVRNDITVSSKLGVDGLFTLEKETTEVAETPEPLVDAESFIGKDACAIQDEKIAGGSSFIIKGKGGLPDNPSDLATRTAMVDFMGDPNNAQAMTGSPTSSPTATSNEPAINIAQAWQHLPDGMIELTGRSPRNSLHGMSHPQVLRPILQPPSCI